MGVLTVIEFNRYTLDEVITKCLVQMRAICDSQDRSIVSWKHNSPTTPEGGHIIYAIVQGPVSTESVMTTIEVIDEVDAIEVVNELNRVLYLLRK